MCSEEKCLLHPLTYYYVVAKSQWMCIKVLMGPAVIKCWLLCRCEMTCIMCVSVSRNFHPKSRTRKLVNPHKWVTNEREDVES